MKTTFVKRKRQVEQVVQSCSGDPILPLAVAYVLAIVVLTVICTYLVGDPIVSIVLVGFGLTGAIRLMLHVLVFFKRPPVMPKRPRKIAGLWRRERQLKIRHGHERRGHESVVRLPESPCSRS